MKITQGKWEYHYDGHGGIYIQTQEKQIGYVSNTEEQEANARLIVLASQMLEALKQAKSIICTLKLSMCVHPDCTEGSEFDDLTTTAQEFEDEIEQLIKKTTE